MAYYELYHHGILGQKWGVRRYQNKDGSLTAAGRKHVGVGEKSGGGPKLFKLKTKTKVKTNVTLPKEVNKLAKKDEDSDKQENEQKIEYEPPKIHQDYIDAHMNSRPGYEMSTQEMRNIINRLNTEKTYYELVTPKKVNKGKEWFNKVVDTGKSVNEFLNTANNIYSNIKKTKAILDELSKK